MPINNDFGYSQNTRIKQEHLANLLAMHIRIVKSIVKRFSKLEWCEPYYYYFDINAGPGLYNDIRFGHISGSPKIFCDIISKLEMPFKAVFIEKDEQWYNNLLNNIDWKRYSLTKDEVLVYHGDHHDILPKFLHSKPTKKKFGLIYNDPSGILPSFDLLANVSECYPEVDILIYVSASNVKRMRKCSRVSFNGSLVKCVSPISKKYWLVRSPIGRHQWTFLLGTNWEKFPQYEKIGFYHSTSDEGINIMKKLNFTSEELEGGNQNESV